MSRILEGIRVVDFGRYIAGPYCGALLADLGADVIRVERPSGGEDRYTVPISEQGEGAYYLQLARNKRGMTLNPASDAGREVVRRLVGTADVVIVNLPAPALKKLGLDYETLSEIKPRLRRRCRAECTSVVRPARQRSPSRLTAILARRRLAHSARLLRSFTE
jgi:crotonobetainyl-CoA:carnitine CoA-transferase CaiB-like acyl-CoA transferase